MTDHDAGTTPARSARRTVLKGAAVAGAVVPFLVACGSSDSTAGAGDLRRPSHGRASSTGGSGGGHGGNAGGGSGGNGNTGGGSSADVLTTTSEVPNGGGVILDDAGIVITQPDAGDFKGFTNICTHMGCPVSNVSGGTINCLCHGSQYSIEDGSVVAGPAPSALAAKPISVRGKDILAG
jgi:nitrite reductase/ring-hydroxylating ferredoxin subunit